MCHELDEDKVLDLLEEKQKPGGLIFEHHVPDLFPGTPSIPFINMGCRIYVDIMKGGNIVANMELNYTSVHSSSIKEWDVVNCVNRGIVILVRC